MQSSPSSRPAIELVVHPGIGDFSWVYSKLVNCGRPLRLRIAPDKKFKRAIPYTDLLPGVEHAEYGAAIDYPRLAQSNNAYWHEFERAADQGQRIYVSANRWLEAGHRIEGFLPDLPITHHYPILTTAEHASAAAELLPIAGGPYFGIYCSGQTGAEMCQAWEEYEWTDFIVRLERHIGREYRTYVLLGAEWDKDLTDRVAEYLGREVGPQRVLNLVGDTPMGVACEVLKRLNYFAGYACGLGIVAHVLKVPGLMLYPMRLQRMMEAWASPEMMASGLHLEMQWGRPMDVLARASDSIVASLSTPTVTTRKAA